MIYYFSLCLNVGVPNLNLSGSDWIQNNLDSLKESMRSSGNDWQNIDMSQFQGKHFHWLLGLNVGVSLCKVIGYS
jgi:hypothetical protein